MIKKLSQVDMSTGINESNIKEIEEALKSTGIPDNEIKEITNVLNEKNDTSEQSNPQQNTMAPSTPTNNTPAPQKSTPGVKNVLQPGNKISSNILTAEEFISRIDKASRLQMCAEDLMRFEEEAYAAAKFLAEEEGINLEEALDITEEDLYADLMGED